MKPIRLFLILLTLALPTRAAEKRLERAIPERRESRQIEGWKVLVDERLLAAENDAIGHRSLQLLEARLADIRSIMPADRLARLQAVTIVLDLTHGDLRPMQYHPGAGW